jgi:hypothetical protein
MRQVVLPPETRVFYEAIKQFESVKKTHAVKLLAITAEIEYESAEKVITSFIYNKILYDLGEHITYNCAVKQPSRRFELAFTVFLEFAKTAADTVAPGRWPITICYFSEDTLIDVIVVKSPEDAIRRLAAYQHILMSREVVVPIIVLDGVNKNEIDPQLYPADEHKGAYFATVKDEEVFLEEIKRRASNG